jgi:L-ascorbate metabolism protein UlaG (beta-lactamase superfamily)
MRSGHHTGVGVMSVLGAVLIAFGGAQVNSIFGQSAAIAVADACEPTAADVDFNGDETVDLRDFAHLAQHWRDREPAVDVAPWPAGDGVVDFNDLSALTRFWLQEAGRPIYITWLGHASVKIVWMDQVIYVDPLDLTTSPQDATLILVTHSHSDHYSPADIARVRNAATLFIAPPDVVQAYGSGQTIAPGQTLQVGDLLVIGVAAYNISTSNHPKANNWVGFIVQIGSRRIYCAGDTDLTPAMKALTDIDVAFLPAGGTYTMTAVQAAEATKYFMPRLAIPYHWGRSVGTLADAQLFARIAACNAKVMTKGETISSDDWDKDYSLLAWWKLDEETGDVAQDSAASNDATLIGDPVWRPTDGRIGGALEFDGVDDYVSAPFVVSPGAGAFSVFAWVKGGAPGQVILYQNRGSNWLMADASDGTLATELKGGRAGKPLKSSAVITDGQWHRVGFVWDGSNRTLYVDDVEVAGDTLPGLPAATDGLTLGGNGLSPAAFWAGLIDDVRIHNRAVNP